MSCGEVGLSYDPWEEARKIGAQVVVSDPLQYVNGVNHIHKGEILGLTLCDQGLIVLKGGKGPIMQRSVLTHEIEHFKNSDRPITNMYHNEMRENACNLAASRKLVDYEELQQVVKQDFDFGVWWRELKVSPEFLNLYINHLSAQELIELYQVFYQAHGESAKFMWV